MGTDPADLPPPSRNDDGAPQQNTAAPKRPFSPDDQQAVRFEDVFCLEEIQRIQDAFAEAAGVGSRITDPSGRPLTQPSNFTTLCQDIIRQTPKGLANCIRSDIHEGVSTADGPCYGTCLSGGLLDGSTSIFFGDRHIANWIIGQVLDEDADPEVLLAYAREIGANEKAYREALALVPRMSKARFAKICRALYHFANHLSALALKNYEQSQSINELRQAQNRIRARDRNLADIIDFFPDPTLVLDKDGTVIFWNKALERLTGVAAVDMKAGIDAEYTIAIVINGKAVELLRRETCHHTEAITKLISSRVRLFVCSNALKERNISETDIISGATFVPAGIVHLVKLQREGFVYVKP